MTRRMIVAGCRTKSSLSVAEVMGVLSYMSGRICGGIAVVSLHAALFLAAPVAGAAEAPAMALAGAEISHLINDRLAAEGLAGAPSIKPDRAFPACDKTPEIEPMFGGWNTVAVRCVSGSGWRFMIRTNLTSRATLVPVREFRPAKALSAEGNGRAIERAVSSAGTPAKIIDEIEVVALSRSMSRNDMIGAADLVMVAVSERNAMGAFFDPADVIGRRMKMGLGVNRPLTARYLYPDYLVEEGSEVLISSSYGGISVDMVGYALENGQIGEWIGVENASSGKTVRGKITGEKKVRVIAKK